MATDNDEQLDALYRHASREEPPARLDHAVLSQARRGAGHLHQQQVASLVEMDHQAVGADFEAALFEANITLVDADVVLLA